jgi:hypothetical protein
LWELTEIGILFASTFSERERYQRGLGFASIQAFHSAYVVMAQRFGWSRVK